MFVLFYQLINANLLFTFLFFPNYFFFPPSLEGTKKTIKKNHFCVCKKYVVCAEFPTNFEYTNGFLIPHVYGIPLLFFSVPPRLIEITSGLPPKGLKVK